MHSSGVESLNKSISVQYASKRSRPAEPRQDDENIIIDGVHDTTLSDPADISNTANQDTARNEDSQPPKKVIRKVNKKRQSTGSSAETTAEPDGSAVGSMIVRNSFQLLPC